MNFKNIISIICIIPIVTVYGQKAEKLEKVALSPVNNIYWKNTNYSDLLFFDTVLQKHSIIVLSEANHGDGSSYEAQCMVMKGLIDSGKVNAIYTESSWMIIDKINTVLKREGANGIEHSVEYMRSIELRYWVDNGFWNYLANKIIEGKVRLFGFDVGASNKIVDSLFFEAIQLDGVKKYLELQKDKKSSNGYSVVLKIKGTFENFNGYGDQTTLGEEDYVRLESFIKVVKKELELTKDYYKVKQWQGLQDYFYWMYNRTELMKDNYKAKVAVNVPKDDKQLSGFHSIRDSLMAATFLNTYSRERGKALVLMANYHSMRKSAVIEELVKCCKEPTIYILNEILDKNLGDEIYSLCFINPFGVHGIDYFYARSNNEKYVKPPKESLEFYLSKNYSGNFCIVDLQQPNLKNSFFYMRPVFLKYFKSKWSENYSGAFYIRDMEPLFFHSIESLR